MILWQSYNLPGKKLMRHCLACVRVCCFCCSLGGAGVSVSSWPPGQSTSLSFWIYMAQRSEVVNSPTSMFMNLKWCHRMQSLLCHRKKCTWVLFSVHVELKLDVFGYISVKAFSHQLGQILSPVAKNKNSTDHFVILSADTIPSGHGPDFDHLKPQSVHYLTSVQPIGHKCP